MVGFIVDWLEFSFFKKAVTLFLPVERVPTVVPTVSTADRGREVIALRNPSKVRPEDFLFPISFLF